jgi:hypothetical protein
MFKTARGREVSIRAKKYVDNNSMKLIVKANSSESRV